MFDRRIVSFAVGVVLSSAIVGCSHVERVANSTNPSPPSENWHKVQFRVSAVDQEGKPCEIEPQTLQFACDNLGKEDGVAKAHRDSVPNTLTVIYNASATSLDKMKHPVEIAWKLKLDDIKDEPIKGAPQEEPDVAKSDQSVSTVTTTTTTTVNGRFSGRFPTIGGVPGIGSGIRHYHDQYGHSYTSLDGVTCTDSSGRMYTMCGNMLMPVGGSAMSSGFSSTHFHHNAFGSPGVGMGTGMGTSRIGGFGRRF